MAIIGNFFKEDLGQAFGFHLNSNPNSTSFAVHRHGLMGHNVTRILSWIPLISIIAAIYDLRRARVYSLQFSTKMRQTTIYSVDYENLALSYEKRAIATLCQATVFLMLFDLFATAFRYMPVKEDP